MFSLDPSLVCQPLHPRKEGLLSLTQRFCAGWVELMHEHTLDNVSLVSKKMDRTKVDTKLRQSVAVLSSWGRIQATVLLHVHCCMMYDRTELRECVYSFTLCTQLHAFCHLIGTTSESRKSIHAQKRYVSETRPSFHGWRGWHAKITSSHLVAIFQYGC